MKLGVTPNFGLMGTEMPVGGNGPANPYGMAFPSSAAPTDSVMSMQGGQDSATSNIGYRPTSGPYRPEAGRADRLSANVVGGGTFADNASGGYSGVYRGAGLTTNQ